MFGQTPQNLLPQQSTPGPLESYINNFLRQHISGQQNQQPQMQAQPMQPDQQAQGQPQQQPGMVDSMISKGLGVTASSTPLQDYMTKALMALL